MSEGALVEVGPSESVGGRLRYWAERQPDARFFRCGGDWVTYGDAVRSSERMAAGLQSVGVGKGDHVAILMPNRPEYVVLILAGLSLGAVQVPINPFLRGEFLRYQLHDSEAETLVSDVEGLSLVLPILSELPRLRRFILVGDRRDVVGKCPVDLMTFAELDASAGVELPQVSASDLAAVMYTSGTTGMPKGCMMTHGYYLTVARELQAAGLMAHDDTLLTPYQLFHTSGQVYSLTTALDVGGIISLEQWFHASTLLDAAREITATVLFGPGVIGPALLKQPERSDDREHSLRVLFGTPFSEEVQNALGARFGLRVCGEIYGQTEVSIPSITGMSDHKKLGTSGRPSPYFDVRLVDDADQEVLLGAVGEIVVRPKLPNGMFSGYWNKPAETVDVWRNLWHHTGDNGRMDEEGYLTFVDRKKDSLRRRGENVSSLELEQAILLHPDIIGVACHPVPSEMGEDEIKACIVLSTGHEMSPADLFSFFRSSLPYFAIPRYVELLDELPMSVMSRVQKYKLTERGINDSTWDFEQLGLVVERQARRSL